MVARVQIGVDFNPRMPPLFLPGGLLAKAKTNGGYLLPDRIAFYLRMEDQVQRRSWESLYRTAWDALALAVFTEDRRATAGERSQLAWLRNAAHGEWIE